MNGSVIALTICYALLGLLLLSLNLKSAWPWPIKAVAIGTAAPLFIATFAALHMLTGWPSDTALPTRFQLHAALVEEPLPGAEQNGAIFLWLTPSVTPTDDSITNPSPPRTGSPPGVAPVPRAFALPYSRDLHNRVEAMREALQKGRTVEGRHRPGSSLERRFGQQQGGIDLFTPPPPPMPSKD